jgi:hypothetical protein
MKCKFASAAVVAFLVGCTTAQTAVVGEYSIKKLGSLSRGEEVGKGLSGITRVSDTEYWCVEDRGGKLHQYELLLNDDGEPEKFELKRTVNAKKSGDAESCEYDPLTSRIWLADEYDRFVKSYNRETGEPVDDLVFPEIFKKHMVYNKFFEAMTMSKDGLTLWVMNEDTLKCDGAVAKQGKGGKVRIQEFVRRDGKSPWQTGRQFFYLTDPVDGKPYKNLMLSGVSSMQALDDGSLLVLEHEMSMKNPIFPTFRCRIYRVIPGESGATLSKELLWGGNTGFANYEGLCFGPTLKNGRRTLVMVTDAGNHTEDLVTVLELVKTK